MLRIDRLNKRFEDGFLALSGVNLTVERGEIVSLVGTSGCGKSTLLRIVGGLDHATQGEVQIDQETVRAPRLEIGIVFQEPRLMPWLTVADRSEEHTSELQSLMRNSYAVFCLTKKTTNTKQKSKQ